MENTNNGKSEGAQPPAGDTGKGSEPSAASILERANAAFEKLEATEKRIDSKLNELANARLGGNTLAGQPILTAEQLAKKKDQEVIDSVVKRFGLK